MSLDDVYAKTAAGVRARVVKYATRSFGPETISEAGAAEFAAQVLPVIAAGQQQTAALTDAYLTRVLANEHGERIVGDRIIDTSQGLRGVDMSEVYSRPAKTARYALSQGKSLSDAVTEASNRLIKMVQSDLQIAKTQQARSTLRRSSADGFQRVLNGPRSCAKCVVASVLFYSKEDLLPIHPGCDCGVKPARRPRRGKILHEDRLKAIHDLVELSGLLPADPSAKDYENLIVVHEHGELGPVIALRNERFRGPDDVQKPDRSTPAPTPTTPSEAKSAAAKRLLPGLESSLANLRAKGLPEDAPQIQYHLTQIAKLRNDLAN